MNYDQFVTALCDRGEYPDRSRAEEVTTWVLEVLARRLTHGEADDHAAQLPAPSPRRCSGPKASPPRRSARKSSSAR